MKTEKGGTRIFKRDNLKTLKGVSKPTGISKSSMEKESLKKREHKNEVSKIHAGTRLRSLGGIPDQRKTQKRNSKKKDTTTNGGTIRGERGGE